MLTNTPPTLSTADGKSMAQAEAEMKKYNLKIIQESVNSMRSIRDDKSVETLSTLLWDISKLNPDIKDNEVVFEQVEKLDKSKITHTISADAVRPSATATHPQKNGKNNYLVGHIDMDIDIHAPLLSILNGAKIYRIDSAVSEFQKELHDMYIGLSTSEKNDQNVQKSFLSAANQMQKGLDTIKQRGDFNLQRKDEKLVLEFILAHELAHLAFKDKYDINFQHMDKAKLPQSSQSQKYLGNALLNLNRYLDAQGMQHQGANYASTRDEIHSDIAGIFTAAYLHIKKGQPEQDLYRVFHEIGKLRANMNNAHSIHNMSTHNSNVIYEPEFLRKIVSSAKDYISNPKLDVYNAVLNMTEDAFFETIKRNGIIIKRPFDLDTEAVNAINSGRAGLNSKSVYEMSMAGANKTSRETYETCFSYYNNTPYKNKCLHYLNGAQQDVVDTNNDNRIDQSNLSRALQNGVQTGILAGVNKSITNPTQIEKAVSQLESEALTQFAELNKIPMRTTNQFGADIIELNRDSATVKFK